jgi:hypothetical protein
MGPSAGGLKRRAAHINVKQGYCGIPARRRSGIGAI